VPRIVLGRCVDGVRGGVVCGGRLKLLVVLYLLGIGACGAKEESARPSFSRPPIYDGYTPSDGPKDVQIRVNTQGKREDVRAAVAAHAGVPLDLARRG